mmetsp:Transcript_44/g.170  ORF Transcript_44/g.170 Transcript_44/m.170 type:complete len:204 (-) Transcript_44:657-1268(-)
MAPGGALPKRYVIPQEPDVCAICCDLLTSHGGTKCDIARFKCNHYFCWQCLKGEAQAFFQENGSHSRGTMYQGGRMMLLQCPTCRQPVKLVERIQRPSASFTPQPDRFGGPLRDVTVKDADGEATWVASYYAPRALKDGCVDVRDSMTESEARMAIFMLQASSQVTRKSLPEAWSRLRVTTGRARRHSRHSCGTGRPSGPGRL